MRALATWVLVLFAATLAGGVESGRACSCALPDPRAALAQADGAFVGTLVSRRQLEQQAVLVFAVDRILKGSIGRRVEVRTASNGAACGLEAPIGTRVGLVLERRDGAWHGHLCWQFTPSDLLTAAALPAPNGRGPAAMFVGGRFGPARTMALDAKGRTLAYGMGKGATPLISPCTGGQRVAEVARSDTGSNRDITFEIAIRDTRRLHVIRRQTVDLPGLRFPQGLMCGTRTGSSVVIFAGWAGDSALKAAIYRIADRRLTTVWRGTAFLSSLGPRFAYLRAGYSADRMVRVDLRTGEARTLVRIPLGPSLVPDATGRRLAGVAYRLDQRSRIFLVDLTRRPAMVRSIPLSAPEVFGEVLWISSKRMLFLSADRRETARLLDLRLRTLARFRWTGGQGILVRSTIFGIGQKSLFAATLPSGPTRVARRLPGQPDVIVAATP